MFRAHFHSGLVSRGQLHIIAIDARRYQEALGSYEVKLGNCGDISIGTKSGGAGAHMQFKIQWSLGTGTKLMWYRYLNVV